MIYNTLYQKGEKTMKEVQCPNCNATLVVSDHARDVVCKTCLEMHGKRFIMVESAEKPYRNLGDGFFEKTQ
jgi:ribosomal protein S27AE